MEIWSFSKDRHSREDTLAPRFDGPYRVLRRRDANVKLRRKEKWVHLDHCKRFEGTITGVVQPHNVEPDGEVGSSSAGGITLGQDTNVRADEAEISSEANAVEYEEPDHQEERYPRRMRRAPRYLADYVTQDGIP